MIMKPLNPLKRRSMDAITHHETQTQLRLFSSSPAHLAKAAPLIGPPSPGDVTQSVKKLMMDAISNVETVTQVGMLKVAGGVAVYSAHIHEMDTQAKQNDALRKLIKAQESREHERE